MTRGQLTKAVRVHVSLYISIDSLLSIDWPLAALTAYASSSLQANIFY